MAANKSWMDAHTHTHTQRMLLGLDRRDLIHVEPDQ